ncbi:hypothetical protein [Gallaecimonas mangrovi]|uniref:hypothetical protein n=1 Tax=Gallaecimonas mangrovi TaxID=2291597 RepID=UPI000E1FDFC5|nr:hypothetical protein [Gallaecimonas mangrovi]
MALFDFGNMPGALNCLGGHWMLRKRLWFGLVLAVQFYSFRDIELGSVPLAMFGALLFMVLKMPSPDIPLNAGTRPGGRLTFWLRRPSSPAALWAIVAVLRCSKSLPMILCPRK